MFDGGLLNARAQPYLLSSHIFFLNLGGGDLGVLGVSGLNFGVCFRRSKRVCNFFVCCSLISSRGAF